MRILHNRNETQFASNSNILHIIGTFPTLFPNGVDGVPVLPAMCIDDCIHRPQRIKEINFRDSIVHLLRQSYINNDGSNTYPFQQNEGFVFWARSIVQDL